MMFWLVLACGGGETTEGEAINDSAEQDFEGPVITHDVIPDAQILGQDITVTAVIADAKGLVLDAKLFYKPETAADFKNVALALVAGDDFIATIPGADTKNAGMHYYIWAMDDSLNETSKPDDGASDPYHFTLDVD